MVDVVRHPVGHHHGQDQAKDVVHSSGALHHEYHQRDCRPEHPSQHTRGGQQRVQAGVDGPALEPLEDDVAPHASPRGAQHNGGHEETARNGETCSNGHEDEVHGAVQGQGPNGEEGHMLHVVIILAAAYCRLLAHAEQGDDGVVGGGQEEGGHVVVETILAREPDSILWLPPCSALLALRIITGQVPLVLHLLLLIPVIRHRQAGAGGGSKEETEGAHQEHQAHHLCNALQVQGLGSTQLPQPHAHGVERGTQQASHGEVNKEEGQLLQPVVHGQGLHVGEGNHTLGSALVDDLDGVGGQGGGDEAAPGCLARPEAARLLHAEQHTTHGRSESSRDTRGDAGRHKLTVVLVTHNLIQDLELFLEVDLLDLEFTKQAKGLAVHDGLEVKVAYHRGHAGSNVHHGTLRSHGQSRRHSADSSHILCNQSAEAQQVGNVVAVEVRHDQGHTSTS
mmetsp:Transcript_19521/g.42326  ORF Transcript_19521/g.42326 Transcript_19521/m.42326 type:complete len:451 (-) Transcript_19521:580-1932(-)